MEHKHEEGKFNFEFEENTSLEDKIRIIVREQIIKPYSQKASKEAEVYIYYTEAEQRVVPLEKEMAYRILSTWKLDLYDVDFDEIVDSLIFIPEGRFMDSLFHTKILRLLPAGVTIHSIGISPTLAERLTLAMGHAISEMSCTYFTSLRKGEKVEAKDVYKYETFVNLIDDYLVEYNKHLVKW